MSGSSLGEYGFWSVLEVFDLRPDIGTQLVSFSNPEQALVMDDLLEFFEIMVSMIYNPWETHLRYRAKVIGLNDLQDFLSSGTTGISVRWKNSTFKARHNEFGAVIITDVTIRK